MLVPLTVPDGLGVTVFLTSTGVFDGLVVVSAVGTGVSLGDGAGVSVGAGDGDSIAV